MTDTNLPATIDANAGTEAASLDAIKERIRVYMSRAAEDIIAIGHDLIEAKKQLGHGRFLVWIDANFGMSERTARNFIRVAERFGRSETVSDLRPSVLYELAARSTPDEVVEQAQEKAASGDKVSVADVKKWKDEAKAARKEAAAAQKKLKEAQKQADEANQYAGEAMTKIYEYKGQVNKLMNDLNDARAAQPNAYPLPENTPEFIVIRRMFDASPVEVQQAIVEYGTHVLRNDTGDHETDNDG